MQFSTASKKPAQDTTSLFVALYLILLAFFIILTKDLSFDEYKQTTAMRSLLETFGRPKEESIVFGRLDNVKLDDYSTEIEKLIRNYGTIYTTNNEDVVKVKIPQSVLYYGDESHFHNDKMTDMMQLTSILKRWTDSEPVHISVTLSETNLKQDRERLDFFYKRIFGKKPMVGLRTEHDALEKNVEIKIERNL